MYIILVLWTLHQLRFTPLDTRQHLSVLPELKGSELHTVLEVQPHPCQAQGKNDFPGPAGHTIADTGQDAIGLLGHRAHCWLMFSWLLTSTPMSLSAWTLSSHTVPSL